MNRIAIYLNKYIDGVAYSAPNILEYYSTDRSPLKYYPRIVAQPLTTVDVSHLLRFSFQLVKKEISLPVTPRGAGTSKTGACLGSGLIISTEKMNRIQEIDLRQRLVRVQAGVTYEALRRTLLANGLDLPIQGDPKETIGGLIAKGVNASLNTVPMNIADLVEQMEVVLYDGTIIETNNINPQHLSNDAKDKVAERSTYERLGQLMADQAKRERAEKIPVHDHSGYPGLRTAFRKKNVNLAPIFCGSEGTLGVITEVILRCETVYDDPDTLAVFCHSSQMFEQMAALLKKIGFTDISFYDSEVLSHTEHTGKKATLFRELGDDGYLIIASVKDDSHHVRRKKLRKFRKQVSSDAKVIYEDKNKREEFALLRTVLLAYLNDMGSGFHLPLMDDAYIPIEMQRKYLDMVDRLAKIMEIPMAAYGSLDYNTFSVRPSFSLSTSEGRQKLLTFMRLYTKLVRGCGGHVCGNASDGRFVALYNNAHQTLEDMALSHEIKDIFDPYGIMNPGLKQEADEQAILKHFRTKYNKGLISER